MADTVKHSTGPWRINEHGNIVCYPPELEAGVLNKRQLPDGEADANTILIVAAPDLLEALLCLVEWVEDNAVKPNEIDEVVSARAAISKAEGR